MCGNSNFQGCSCSLDVSSATSHSARPCELCAAVAGSGPVGPAWGVGMEVLMVWGLNGPRKVPGVLLSTGTSHHHLGFKAALLNQIREGCLGYDSHTNYGNSLCFSET